MYRNAPLYMIMHVILNSNVISYNERKQKYDFPVEPATLYIHRLMYRTNGNRFPRLKYTCATRFGSSLFKREDSFHYAIIKIGSSDVEAFIDIIIRSSAILIEISLYLWRHDNYVKTIVYHSLTLIRSVQIKLSGLNFIITYNKYKQ